MQYLTKIIQPSIEEVQQIENIDNYLDDIQKSTFIVSDLPDRERTKTIISFIYSNNLNSLFIVFGFQDKTISIGEIRFVNNDKVNIKLIRNLFDTYKSLYLVNQVDINSNFTQFSYIQSLIFNLFLSPIFSSIPTKGTHLLIAQNINIDNIDVFFDLPYILDLQFRFKLIQNNNSPAITPISQKQIFQFVKGLSSVVLPYNNSVHLLYGLGQQNSVENLQKCKNKNEKNACNNREKVYNFTLQTIREQGGIVEELSDIEQFEKLFMKGNEGRCIQIISHFHFDRFFTKDLETIRMKDIIRVIRQLSAINQLRNDITIDAMTCNNYSELSNLYELGIKYVYSSRHNIDNDLAAFMLYELYTGENAKFLNWKYPYLDGKTYLHEAWSNVSKCFHTMMNTHNHIKIP